MEKNVELLAWRRRTIEEHKGRGKGWYEIGEFWLREKHLENLGWREGGMEGGREGWRGGDGGREGGMEEWRKGWRKGEALCLISWLKAQEEVLHHPPASLKFWTLIWWNAECSSLHKGTLTRETEMSKERQIKNGY
jgi:hypothetical protein